MTFYEEIYTKTFKTKNQIRAILILAYILCIGQVYEASVILYGMLTLGLLGLYQPSCPTRGAWGLPRGLILITLVVCMICVYWYFNSLSKYVFIINTSQIVLPYHPFI